MDEQVRVLGIAGSLRSGSYNKMLLTAAIEAAPDGLEIDAFDIAEIPLYNGDLEAEGFPESVQRISEAIAERDGLLLVTPEYNHGVPGVLKNVIDWTSRPPRSSVLNQKPVAVMGATPGAMGTARAQSQLRQAFVFTNSWPMQQPEFLLARAGEKFDDGGRLIDETSHRFLQAFLESFRQWILRLRV